MDGSFNTAGLTAVAEAFAQASTQVAELCGKLAVGAGAPVSPSVIGSPQAAAGYSQALEGCTRSLAQLTASLATMGQKVTVASAYYNATEAANTISSAP